MSTEGPIFVVGCGSIGTRHLRNLQSLGVGSRLRAFDPSSARLGQTARELGVIACHSLEEGLALHPQAVLVCTPPSDHLRVAEAAIESGADVFVEKPLSHEWAAVERILELATRRGRTLLVGYNLRFHAGLRMVKRLLDEGAIGRLLMLRAEFGQYLPDWRPTQDYREGYIARVETGGGIILDASHEIDYVRWLGGEVESVYCAGGHLSSLEIQTEDSVAMLLRLAGGVVAEVHLDCVQRGYARGCKLIGEAGTLVWEFREGVRLRTASSQEWQVFPVTPEANEMYLDEMRHFLACVDGSAEALVDGASAARVLRIAIAAKESMATGREVRP